MQCYFCLSSAKVKKYVYVILCSVFPSRNWIARNLHKKENLRKTKKLGKMHKFLVYRSTCTRSLCKFLDCM